MQIQGNTGILAEVRGTVFRSLATERTPVDYGALGFYRLSMQSGTIAAATNGEVFQFRWPDATRLALVYKVAVSAHIIVVPTAATICGLEAVFARGWTAAGTGGTRATLTGNNAKLRTSMGTSLVNDAGISTTAALVAGTKTLDTHGMGNVFRGVGTAAITAYGSTVLFDRVGLIDADGEGQHPMVLAQNEGFVIRTAAAMPAAMTWQLGVTVVWAEVAAF